MRQVVFVGAQDSRKQKNPSKRRLGWVSLFVISSLMTFLDHAANGIQHTKNDCTSNPWVNSKIHVLLLACSVFRLCRIRRLGCYMIYPSHDKQHYGHHQSVKNERTIPCLDDFGKRFAPPPRYEKRCEVLCSWISTKPAKPSVDTPGNRHDQKVCQCWR